MGLRTASVRHSHVVVMAPALTDAAQSQAFNLPPKTDLKPVSPLTSYNSSSKYQVYIEEAAGKCLNNKLSNEFNHSKVQSEKSEQEVENQVPVKFTEASENNFCHFSYPMMSNSPISMGDLQQDKMGLQKACLDPVSSIVKDKSVASDVEQILNNINSDISQSSDIVHNVEEIMQVISSMDVSSGQLNNVSNETEEVFPIQGLSSLSSFEKELLNDVDMMNISIEEQQDQLENQAKDLIMELKKRQVKVERRLDFLRKKVLKLQARWMGLHVSSEVAGVYEYVHRTLKRLKDSSHEVHKPNLESNSNLETPPAENIPDKPKPISYGITKNLARKLEMSAVLQANTAARQRHTAKYFGSGSLEPPMYRSNVNSMLTVPPWLTDHKEELQKVSGTLHTELSVVQDTFDSEATDSSSGGESCDEMQTYNNPHQQYLSIQKRALWKYSTERAAIAARWTWLQAQISDLEYRIRQHTDLQRQIKAEKGPLTLGGASPPASIPSSPTAVNGYRGQLPGTSSTMPKTRRNSDSGVCNDYLCARARPLIGFKKRKVLQTHGLHVVSKKAARPSTVRCECMPPIASCAVCTGRTDPTYPRDPPETLGKQEKIALLDQCFHPVFSLPEDVSESIHLDAIMKTNEWQQRSTRMKPIKMLSKADRIDKAAPDNRTNKLEHRKKYSRILKPVVPSLSAKIKNKIRGRKAGRHSLNRLHRKRHTAKVAIAQLQALAAETVDEEVESIGNNSSTAARSVDSPSSSPLLHIQSISGYTRKSRINSYDIDNIVIPYSVAASTRVEKLEYKEILTPKWRIADPDFAMRCESKNNGEVRKPSQDSDVEDLSEEAVIIRHDKSEHDEKKKFLSYLKLPVGYGRSRSHKRTDSHAESSGGNTPDPMSPHPADHHIDHHENTNSPLTSPPATPLSTHTEDSTPLPSVSVMRRRAMSQCRIKDKDSCKEEFGNVMTEQEEVAPYELRSFPLSDEVYDKMLKNMPENHQLQTNIRAQDSLDFVSSLSYLDDKIDSPGSESTESALGDEDPNDPEWIEVERPKDRHKR